MRLKWACVGSCSACLAAVLLVGVLGLWGPETGPIVGAGGLENGRRMVPSAPSKTPWQACPPTGRHRLPYPLRAVQVAVSPTHGRAICVIMGFHATMETRTPWMTNVSI